MAYTALEAMRTLNTKRFGIPYPAQIPPAAQDAAGCESELERLCVAFVRERCEGLHFDTTDPDAVALLDRRGTSIVPNIIPINMEKDIDRLCLERAISRFARIGGRGEALEVYFCFMTMFLKGDSSTRKMLDLLDASEAAEATGSTADGADPFVCAMRTFLVGLALFQSDAQVREIFAQQYDAPSDVAAAHKFLEFWGRAALLHDASYPFESLFAQVDAAAERLCARPATPNVRATESNLTHLYFFAAALNARWLSDEISRNAREKKGLERVKEDIALMEREFDKLSLEYKLSNIMSARAFARHLDAIGCFYTDRAVPYEALDQFTLDDLAVIGPNEHKRWLDEKIFMGWTWDNAYTSTTLQEQTGCSKKEIRELTRTHEDMDPSYQALTVESQLKDVEPMKMMLRLLGDYGGLHVYRLPTLQ